MTRMTSTTSTEAGHNLTLDHFRRWEQMAREMRRTNVTVVVVDGHIGPPQVTKHPTEGTLIECSFTHAQQINSQVPLRLSRIISADRAHFEVAVPGMSFTPLIPPPYYPPEIGS